MDSTSCPVSPTHWKQTLKADGTPILRISIRRPTFPDSGKKRRIERYFSQLAQQWQMHWETKLYQDARQAYTERTDNASFAPWAATMDYQITYWDTPFISIRIDIREQGPNVPPISLCIGEVWDINSGYPCSLHTFLPPKIQHWKRSLVSQLQQQAKQRLSSGESLLDSDSDEKMKSLFDPERFYLTENGLALFYPLYSLGPYAEGIPTFTIPIPDSIQSNKFRALSKMAQRW